MGGTSNQLAPNTRGNNKRIGRAGSRQSLVSVGAAGSESKPFKQADEFASLPAFDPYLENKTSDDALAQKPQPKTAQKPRTDQA